MVDLQDKYQAILVNLLKEEDNKYCTDCDAKGYYCKHLISISLCHSHVGPRWASWNLGFFVCIRCAGIHRNLGVHISKVKSVNLDSWNECQIAMMQMMGNNRARSIYECTMPKTLRRPQTDTTLEAFIRNKYEHKIYIGNATIPAMPTELVPENVVLAAKNGPKFLEMKKQEPQHPVPMNTTANIVAPSSNNIQLMDPFGFDCETLSNEQIISKEKISNPSEDLFGDFVSEPVAQVEQQDQPMSHKDKIMSLFNHSSSSPDLQMRGQMMPQYQQQQQQQQQHLPMQQQVEYAQPKFNMGQNYQTQRPQMPVMIGGQNNVPLTNIPARFMTAYHDTMNICKNGTYKPNDVSQQQQPQAASFPASNGQYGVPMNGQYPNQFIRPVQSVPNTYQHPGNAPVFQPMQTAFGVQNSVVPNPTQYVNQYGYPVQAPTQAPAGPDNKAFVGHGAMKADGTNFNQMINTFNQTTLNDVPPNVNKGNTFNQDLW